MHEKMYTIHIVIQVGEWKLYRDNGQHRFPRLSKYSKRAIFTNIFVILCSFLDVNNLKKCMFFSLEGTLS